MQFVRIQLISNRPILFLFLKQTLIGSGGAMGGGGRPP